MKSFDDRTQQAKKLEGPFIRTLNKVCQTHRIANFGVENTDVKQLHPYIRKAYDISSRFVRFLPDSVMVRTDDNGIGPKTALVEFKVQDTLVEYDSFFRRIKMAYQARKRPLDPELTEKSEIFEVEKDALDIYNEIATKLEVVVIVIGWQTPTDRFIAQYANKIVICNEWRPNRAKSGDGSLTTIYNTHIHTYQPLDTFLSEEFGIQDRVSNAIMQNIRGQQ